MRKLSGTDPLVMRSRLMSFSTIAALFNLCCFITIFRLKLVLTGQVRRSASYLYCKPKKNKTRSE